MLPDAFDFLRTTGSSIVIVVSPLIALMKVQVEALECRGVRAVYLHSGTGDETYSTVCWTVFLSPETHLKDKGWRYLAIKYFSGERASLCSGQSTVWKYGEWTCCVSPASNGKLLIIWDARIEAHTLHISMVRYSARSSPSLVKCRVFCQRLYI